MSTHNICLYKEVRKKYTGCNLKTKEFLDCVLIGVCVVIRSNMVSHFFKPKILTVLLISPQNMLLMSTHNVCFCGEIRKYLSLYPSYPELNKPWYFYYIISGTRKIMAINLIKTDL